MSADIPRRPSVRRTRFVCISDTHNQTPKLPAGDVLIHAGDLTNQGSFSELQKTVAWIEKADFELKIVVAGNHDATLDTPFYEKYGNYFHNQDPQDPIKCQSLLKSSPTINYLEHELRECTLWSESGPRTRFKVFGSPYSPAQGNWAFQYPEENATKTWEEIPLDSDIVVTHAPPYNHCDFSKSLKSRGCEALRKALWRVRPKLAICGHTHEGRGVERVKWRLDLPFSPFLEESTTHWQDPGQQSNKQSLVDLSAKGGSPLDNHQTYDPPSARNLVSFSSGPFIPMEGEARTISSRRAKTVRDQLREGDAESAQVSNASIGGTSETEDVVEDLSRLHAYYTSAVRGRLERKETCIVNAAITANSWGRGPKRFNKPIVVDIDLPVWDNT